MRAASVRRGLWLAADVLLGFMLAGPLVAPLFRALDWPVLREVAWFIYALGAWICPQDERIPVVLGAQLIVCTRCLAALLGLLGVRLVYRGDGPLTTLGMLPRATIAAAAYTLWTVDVWGEQAGLWFRPEWALALGGAFLGVGLALVITGALGRRRFA